MYVTRSDCLPNPLYFVQEYCSKSRRTTNFIAQYSQGVSIALLTSFVLIYQANNVIKNSHRMFIQTIFYFGPKQTNRK